MLRGTIDPSHACAILAATGIARLALADSSRGMMIWENTILHFLCLSCDCLSNFPRIAGDSVVGPLSQSAVLHKI